MANVNFKLRNPKTNTPQIIYLAYYFGHDKLMYSTNLKILPKYWNGEKMRVRNVVEALGKETINNYLDRLYKAVTDYKLKLVAAGEQITKAGLKNYLDIFTGKIAETNVKTFHGFVLAFLKRNKKRVNPKTGRIVSYKVQREHERTFFYITEYEKEKRHGLELDFKDITIDFYTDFTAYLQSKNLSANTIGHKIQTLKTWLNNATILGVNTNYQYKSQMFKASTEHTESVYLSEKELETLYNTAYKSKRLERVRDLFLLGAYTGLRYSDLTTLTAANFHGGMFHIKQHKTGGVVEIPLHPIVWQIWQKYGGKLPKTISNQKFNDYLKEACKLAGIDDYIQKTITKGGLRVTQTFRKYELVTSHTGRRSFATNLYLSGFPALSIMKITGHKSERAFMAYIRADSLQYAKQLREHWANNGEFVKQLKAVE